MKMVINIFLKGIAIPIVIIILTGCSQQKDQPKDNLQIAIEAVEQNKTAENYLMLSLRYYEAGQFEQCIEAAQKALALDPDYAAAYNNICASYNQLKMWNKGIEACKRALEIDPEFQLATNNLEWALSQMKVEGEKDSPNK